MTNQTHFIHSKNNALTIQLFFVYYPLSEENHGKILQPLHKYPPEKVIKICEWI
jgi:hypothetical protein